MNILKNKKIAIVTFMITLLIISFAFFYGTLNHPLKGDRDVTITIESGDSFYSLLNELHRNDVIKSPLIIKTYVKFTNAIVDVEPGQYKLHNNMSIKDIVNALKDGDSIDSVYFTIPEGFNIDEIANKLQTEGICKSYEFIESVVSYPLPSYIKENNIKKYNLEGFLFPDTYQFSKTSDPTELIAKMLERFEEVWANALEEAKVTIKDEDVNKIITIASMIEKEARVNEERDKISSVIYNRINKGMQLQIDATVIYALEEHVDTVLFKHLEIDSPYNTYKIDGLPVGPISNPGLPSIIAALKPANTDYLFYVLQNDGSHYFTNDDEDFKNKLEELGHEFYMEE